MNYGPCLIILDFVLVLPCKGDKLENGLLKLNNQGLVLLEVKDIEQKLVDQSLDSVVALEE